MLGDARVVGRRLRLRLLGGAAVGQQELAGTVGLLEQEGQEGAQVLPACKERNLSDSAHASHAAQPQVSP